ncbi:MAG: 23S rRNA (adenine(2503)-C(2))-methyltransferase RlmN [Anaerolineaceae bacterium]|nr:23S rRNA (adenine(2503)-C(2))-methyltransferase RlmN [Anaerolineaceae bacterium]
MSVKPFFFDLDIADLKEHFKVLNEPPFRAQQLWQAMYVQLEHDPQQITTLPKSLRTKLQESMEFSRLNPIDRLVSSDGETVKTLFRLPDGLSIEAVLMHYDERDTLCISSQAGCAMGCVFCATGQMGFKRNLSSGEIIEQVIYYARELAREKKVVTNIVIMGMGEPFHNYEAVMSAIDRLNDPRGLNLGARRFTISTVGVVPMIRQFATEKRQVNLAISLHAANDALRSKLLPINRRYPLQDLMQACRDYVSMTNRRLSFEWALIQGVNDSPTDARELASLVKGLLCHVNIIPLNPTTEYDGKPTTRENAEAFKNILESSGVPCTIRLRRGIDIRAGCGQLASKHQ